MFPKLCGFFALVVTGLTAYACVAAILLSNSEVQALFAQVFRPEVDFGGASFVLNSLAQFGVLVVLGLLALGHLLHQEMNRPSRLVRNNNRVDRVRDVVTEPDPQPLHGSMFGS